MLFNSMQFLIFLPIVLLVYYVIRWQNIKTLWLLAASYYFYMCWNAKYALLLLTSTVVTYISGLLIDRIGNSDRAIQKKIKLKKIVVASSFGINLSILFYFKYSNFVFDILGQAFNKIGIELNVPTFDVLLPVGISFYTFQALSYTMDIYRGEIYAEKNFVRYALFVSFFPQLVAGPIERSKNLLKQLAVLKKFDVEKAKKGIMLMLWGFFLKIVIADRAAIFVNTIYGDYTSYEGWYITVATMLFAVQIYCDFYGYSVIAIGAAKILNIDLMENFEAPYLSTSVADFWRRWHISLTSWFKDYLYIPLGGSRKGKIRKNINKMIVFLVSGLWHGTSLSFVVWGGLNGAYQILGDIFKPIRDKFVKIFKLNRDSIAHKAVQVLITFVLINFSWIFFRANRLKEAIAIIKQMFKIDNKWIFFDKSLFKCGLDERNFLMLVICILVLIIADYFKRKGIKLHEIILKQDYWFRWIFIAFAVLFILTFGIWGPGYDAANFIYFQF